MTNILSFTKKLLENNLFVTKIKRRPIYNINIINLNAFNSRNIFGSIQLSRIH